MALFGSLVKWGLGDKQPGIVEPDLLSSEEAARKAITTGSTLLPSVQALESDRTDFLTGQITKRQNIFAPWLSAFGKNLGETSTALAAGKLPPEIAKAYERSGRSAAFGGGFGYAPKAGNLAALFGAEGALRGIATGVSTAESWLALMNNIYAPATVNYAEKYLPSYAQTAAHETSKELTETSYRNLARQFDYATDPIRGVYGAIGDLEDWVSGAVMAYLGGSGGIGSTSGGSASGGGSGINNMLGGLLGGLMGGGAASGAQFSSGVYSPGYSVPYETDLGYGAVGGQTTYGPSWFGFGRNSSTSLY